MAEAGVALVTGGARRLGSAIITELHAAGMDVIVHYRRSAAEAAALAARLNATRAGSAELAAADLTRRDEVERLMERALAFRGRLDALVHNASVYRPTPVADEKETTDAWADAWREMSALHMEAPLTMTRLALPSLRRHRGSVVCITDVFAERPLADHPVYCSTKAGLAMLTRCLARDLAPDVRVNAIAPGAVLWPPEGDTDAAQKEKILAELPMRRLGEPEDIARAVHYLVCRARYVTGAVLTVDGGRRLVL